MSNSVKANQFELGSLHDAKLVGLSYEPDESINLAFVRDDGTHANILLRGVRRFVANNLLGGNIVLDVLSTKFGNLNLASLDEIIRSTFPDEFASGPPQRVQASNRQWEICLGQIKAGELQALVIEPSYGAEVVAIFSDIELTIISSPPPTPKLNKGDASQ